MRENTPEPDDASNQRRAVLIVEDDDAVRQFAVRVLEQAGYDVQASATPEEAIALARETRPIDALILDVVLPRMSGITTATEIRRNRPFIPILFMSGYPVDAVAGATDFIGKPFSPAELLSAVDEVIRRGWS